MLSKEAISEFQRIYEDEFGEKISLEKATELVNRLISLMKVIYRPISE